MSEQQIKILHPINVRSYLEKNCSDLIAQYEVRDGPHIYSLEYSQESCANISLVVSIPSILPTIYSSVMDFHMDDISSMDLWALGAHNFNKIHQRMLQEGYSSHYWDGEEAFSQYCMSAQTINDIKKVFTCANDVVKYLNKE